ncbi:hypothetical protein AAFF_G00434480 [Aldrovandia affinis]|uniref:ZP domain-containing protein n=1 Tax=Aldrovandia affinis TaxID=143900 RepID=A0AAD7S8A8_9TELE|nr:hypothetical protein AAFF_G00434480 [Aldrovandia affinis]
MMLAVKLSTAADRAQCFYAKEVTVQCLRDGQFVVVVASETTLPRLSLDSVSLLEGGNVASCGPVSTTPAFVIFQFPVSACGTKMREEGGYVVYENELSSSYEVASGPLGSITRDSVHELSFQCRYFGSEVVSLVAEVNTVPPPLPVTAQGPLSVELRLANGQCDAKGCSDANVYSSYYSGADYPVTKVLRDPVCGSSHPGEDPIPTSPLTLGLSRCPYHDDRYLTTLVPVDHSSGLPDPTHYKRFIFQMFTFVDAVFLPSQAETVMRHATKGVQLRREAAVVSSGEVIVVTSQPAALDRRVSDSDHQVPQSLSYGLLGVAGLAVLAVSALVLAVVWRSRPQLQATKL